MRAFPYYDFVHAGGYAVSVSRSTRLLILDHWEIMPGNRLPEEGEERLKLIIYLIAHNGQTIK